jgi:4-amino-4-deoxy-L-arabinose transferase-like glycosyltransferase
MLRLMSSIPGEPASAVRPSSWSRLSAASDSRVRQDAAALALILVLAGVLRLYRLADTGQNLYYAAGVRSMLDSWHNLFYLSFDPGGSLMIDKPPLGLWLEAGSAKLFGFHYWALALPQAIAGILAVGATFLVVRRLYGRAPACLAAAFLAIMPMSVASARNNTFDTITMLLVLLAGWAVIEAVRRDSLGWLIFCAALLGLAFNTKMAEAFLPLPAFGLFFVLQSRSGRREMLQRGAAFMSVLLAVSLAWVLAVGLTPASDRPTVYNGPGNSIWTLTFEYNGLYRIIGTRPQARIRGSDDAPSGGDTAALLQASKSPPRGPLRLFWGKLGTQIGWFMPLAVAGLAVLLKRRHTRHPSDVLWASWFVSGALYFSISVEALPQYLEAIAAPTAVLAAMGVLGLLHLLRTHPRPALALVCGYLAYAALLLASARGEARLAIPIVAALGVMALITALSGQMGRSSTRFALPSAAILAAMVAGPFAWSMVTAAEPAAGSATRYPVAGPEEVREYQPAAGGDFPKPGESDPVLAFLESHTAGSRYLVLTERALFGNAARYILETNRPVLTFDTFQGDQVRATRTVSALVADGQLRYLELPPAGPWSDPKSTIGSWFSGHCRDITSAALRPLGGEAHLYECAP